MQASFTSIQQYNLGLQNLIQQGKLAEIRLLLDDLELNIDIDPNHYTHLHGVVHLLSYLNSWDIVNALNLWERQFPTVRAQQPIPMIKDILGFAQERKYKLLQQNLVGFIESLKSFDKREYMIWVPGLLNQAEQATIQFLLDTFTTVSLSDFKLYFPFKDPSIVIEELGWTQSGDWVQIVPLQSKKQTTKAEIDLFDQLTHIISQLKS